MRASKFEIGDWVIYRKLKHSASPGPRASNVSAAPKGEFYSYIVEKFWIVQDVLRDERLRIRTRKGKEHLIDVSDPNLRRASWWERWVYRSRFQEIETSFRLP